MENVSVYTGKTASLTCTVHSYPQPEVKWYKDGRILNDITQLISIEDCRNSKKGKYFTIVNNINERIGFYNYTLVICNSDWKVNNGFYTCEVKNKLGTDSRTANIHVYSAYLF